MIKMNTKAIAVLMAALMVATCAAVVVSADQTEAKNNDVIKVDPVNFEGDNNQKTGTLTLYMNKQEYKGYANNVEWSYLDSNGEYKTISSESKVMSNAKDVGTDDATGISTVSASYTTNDDGKPLEDGEYKFIFTTSGTDSKDFTIQLKCELTVTVDKKETLNLFYTVPLNVNAGDDGTISIDSSGAISIGPMTATVMEPFEKKVYGNSGTISKYQGYNWYAVGLPDGLSMNLDGTVTGVPTKATDSTGVQVDVVAVNKENNAQCHGSFTFTVYAGLIDEGDASDETDSVRYNYSVRVNGGESITSPSTLLVVQSDDVRLTVTAVVGNFSTVKMTVVGESQATGEDGKAEYVYLEKTLTGSNATNIELPTTGTGAYRVILSTGATSPTTVYFDLIVISDIEDLRSGIIVQGA